MKFVAVTSCPTGIAHTYMAAEALEQAAADAGDEMHVETQGSAGSDPLDPQIIADADAVIFAADVEVRDRGALRRQAARAVGRQAGHQRRGRRCWTRRGGRGRRSARRRCCSGRRPPRGGGLAHQGRLRRRVRHAAAPVADDGRVVHDPVRRRGRPADRAGLRARRLRDHQRAEGHRTSFDPGSLQSWAALLFQIGGIAFGFLVPILAGFIAFAMADRPGLVPGIVGGCIAVQVGAGFLGGLVAGLLAGAVVLGIRKIKVPRSVAGIMPVVVIPLVSTLIVGILMFVVLGPPLAALADRADQLAERPVRRQQGPARASSSA